MPLSLSWRAALAAVPLVLVVGALPGGADSTVSVGPGVTYRVVERSGSRAFVATVDPGQGARPGAVLAGDRLGVVERTSSMAARSGAVLAVNGDFGLASGRPVHALAADGVLVQTAQAVGRGVASTRTGRSVLGYPAVDVAVVDGSRRTAVVRWNSGAPGTDDVVGFTAAGGSLERPGSGACYAALAPAGATRTAPDGRATTPAVVRVRRCSSTPPAVPRSGAVLVARPGGAGDAALRTLQVGRAVQLASALGTTGGWSLVGASEQLVAGGRVTSDVDAPGAYVQDPAPRTAAGLTRDGRLLLVVVDGRQPGWSTGMSLRQLARLLVDLGAVRAVNLDGGGSSAFWARGQLLNRPSDGTERAVSSALVVRTSDAAPAPAPDGLGLPDPADLLDPASTGGLLAPRDR